MRALIIANGEPPSEKLLQIASAAADFIIAADGAARQFASDFIIGDFDSFYQNKNFCECCDNFMPHAQNSDKFISPAQIFGRKNCLKNAQNYLRNLSSAAAKTAAKTPAKTPAKKPLLLKKASQNSCDLAKAFKFAYALGAAHIDIIGAAGAREDHAIGNFALFCQFASIAFSRTKKPLKVRMHSDFGSFLPLKSEEILSGFAGANLSIFARANTDKISSSGLEFALNSRKILALNLATLNKINSEQMSLKIRTSAARAGFAIVYLSGVEIERRLRL